MDKDIKLKIEGVNKSFPGVKALDDINFSVKKGSVHVLCGENGAGKSTLMKIINGIYNQDSGEIYIDGELVDINSPVEAQDHGISMIFQELNYVPEMTVEENFVAGRWPTNKFGKVNWKKARETAKDLLEEEGLDYSLHTKLKSLTISDIQLLEISKAVSYDSDIIIMDELGRFEIKAHDFQNKVIELLKSDKLVLGVIKLEKNKFLDKVRGLLEKEPIVVTEDNREYIYKDILKSIKKMED